MRADELAQAIHGQLPDVVIVHLEGIVPAVLAEPELDVVTAQLLGQLGRLVQQLQRLGANRGVWIGDRALDVVTVVDLRRDSDNQLVALERRLDVVQRPLVPGERPVQVDDDGQVADRARCRSAPAARQAAHNLGRVTVFVRWRSANTRAKTGISLILRTPIVVMQR